MTREEFSRLITRALKDPSTTLDEAARLAAKVVEKRDSSSDIEWMKTWLSVYPNGQDHFLLFRLREVAGGPAAPRDDDYVLAMIGALGSTPNSREFLLTLDHELREDVFWRLFEVEGGGQVSLTNADKFSRFGETATWQRVVLGLVERRVIERERVLKATLDALQRDFSQYTAGWFSRLFTAMAPTTDELGAHQADVLGMLASRVGPTVTLAVHSLRALHKAGRLNVDALAEHARPAMLSAKANATALLKILQDGSGAGDPTARAGAIAEALDHPHPDVRAHAQRALREMGRSDLLASAEAEAVSVAAAPEPAGRGAARTVTPWPADEVVERLGSVLAGNADGLEFELALAALAALEDRSALAPLMKTARRRIEPPDRPRHGPTAAMLLARLLLRLMNEEFVVEEWDTSERSVVGARSKELGTALGAAGPVGVLLATPEDTSGWVSPATFVDRLLERDRAGVGMLSTDLIAALLRLSSRDRASALDRLPSQPTTATNEIAFAAARYALGGEMRLIEPVEWWIAAARARNPLGDDALLVAAGHGEPGAGSRTAAKEEWVSIPSQFDKNGPGIPRLQLTGGPMTRIHPLRPTCTPSSRRRYDFLEWRQGEQLFVELACPADADVASMLGLQTLLEGRENTTEYGQTEILDGLSRHPGAWGPLSASALVIGMAQQPSLTRIHAAELFAAAVPHRVPVKLVADALERHAPGCVITRWASTLRDASSISTPARAAVAQTLAAFLPRLANGSRGLDKLLDVLVETTDQGSSVLTDAELQAWLASFNGSSRAAKLARTLLAR